LEAQGRVSRRPDAADRRRTLIELTDAGRRTLTEDRRRREGWLAQAIANDFTGDEQEILGRAIRLLERLTEL
ncbi:MAG: hypothetical protein ACRDL8_21135, partial [Solirubrobacteraceae bacterium]